MDDVVHIALPARLPFFPIWQLQAHSSALLPLPPSLLLPPARGYQSLSSTPRLELRPFSRRLSTCINLHHVLKGAWFLRKESWPSISTAAVEYTQLSGGCYRSVLSKGSSDSEQKRVCRQLAGSYWMKNVVFPWQPSQQCRWMLLNGRTCSKRQSSCTKPHIVRPMRQHTHTCKLSVSGLYIICCHSNFSDNLIVHC